MAALGAKLDPATEEDNDLLWTMIDALAESAARPRRCATIAAS